MKLSDLSLNRYLYKSAQSVETKDSTFMSFDSTPAPVPGVASGGAAQDINTGNVFINGGQLEPGTIPQTVLDVSNWGWGQTCAFTSASGTQVNWGVGAFKSADGTTYSISAGNTGAMAAKTYIYLDLNVSDSAYQITTTAADAVGIGKVLIAVAQNAVAGNATFNLSEATQIVGDNILANSINASKIVTGQLIVGTNVGLGTAQDSAGVTTIIGNTVTTGFVNALSITAGSVAAENITGTYITGKVFRTASSSTRVEISGATNDMRIYSGSTLRARGYDSGWSFYNTSGATVADIYADTSAYGSKSLLITANGVTDGNLILQSDDTGTIAFYNGSQQAMYINQYSVYSFYDILPASSDLELGSESLYSWRRVHVDTVGFVYSDGSEGTPFPVQSGWSVTHLATGRYRVNHPMSTNYYSVVVTPLAPASKFFALEAKTSSSFTVRIGNYAGALEDNDFTFICLNW